MVITFSAILKEILSTLRSYEFLKKFIFYLAMVRFVINFKLIIYIYIYIYIMYKVWYCSCSLSCFIYLSNCSNIICWLPFPHWIAFHLWWKSSFCKFYFWTLCWIYWVTFFSLYQYYTVWLQYFYRNSWNQTMKILQIYIFKKAFFPFIRWLGSGDVKCCMMIMLNNNVLYI